MNAFGFFSLPSAGWVNTVNMKRKSEQTMRKTWEEEQIQSSLLLPRPEGRELLQPHLRWTCRTKFLLAQFHKPLGPWRTYISSKSQRHNGMNFRCMDFTPDPDPLSAGLANASITDCHGEHKDIADRIKVCKSVLRVIFSVLNYWSC